MVIPTGYTRICQFLCVLWAMNHDIRTLREVSWPCRILPKSGSLRAINQLRLSIGLRETSKSSVSALEWYTTYTYSGDGITQWVDHDHLQGSLPKKHLMKKLSSWRISASQRRMCCKQAKSYGRQRQEQNTCMLSFWWKMQWWTCKICWDSRTNDVWHDMFLHVGCVLEEGINIAQGSKFQMQTWYSIMHN